VFGSPLWGQAGAYDALQPQLPLLPITSAKLLLSKVFATLFLSAFWSLSRWLGTCRKCTALARARSRRHAVTAALRKRLSIFSFRCINHASLRANTLASASTSRRCFSCGHCTGQRYRRGRAAASVCLRLRLRARVGRVRAQTGEEQPLARHRLDERGLASRARRQLLQHERSRHGGRRT